MAAKGGGGANNLKPGPGNAIKAVTNGHHHTNGGTHPDGGYVMGKGGSTGQTSASKVPGRTEIGKQAHVNINPAKDKPSGGAGY